MNLPTLHEYRLTSSLNGHEPKELITCDEDRAVQEFERRDCFLQCGATGWARLTKDGYHVRSSFCEPVLTIELKREPP